MNSFDEIHIDHYLCYGLMVIIENLFQNSITLDEYKNSDKIMCFNDVVAVGYKTFKEF